MATGSQGARIGTAPTCGDAPLTATGGGGGWGLRFQPAALKALTLALSVSADPPLIFTQVQIAACGMVVIRGWSTRV